MTSTTTPPAFAYLECRPCIQPLDERFDVVSYRDESTFEKAMENAKAEGFEFTAFWTCYGIDEDGLAHAIADVTDKDAAHQLMGGILGVMAAVRDVVDVSTVDRITDTETLKERLKEASRIVEDFILQCSNHERI